MTLSYYSRKLLKVYLFLSLFIVQESFAQGSGSIKGTIFDETTKEGLPSANLLVDGTTIGTATDLDGEFVLRNVPSGSQSITASYIGYSSQTVVIEIFENRTVEQDFYLTISTVVGEEVVVTAQSQGQLEAINQQLASDKIVNILSEARLQELPDFNVAQSLSRLPGVSTLQSSGEANKIVIRGLAPQFNAVQLEGIRMASTGSTTIGAISQATSNDPSGSINIDRSVDLSLISPYMLKSVQLYKALTPDFNANAVGGTVNMELRQAPSELHFDILWQAGFQSKSNTYDNYRGVASVSKRFFDDLLGVYLLGNLESYDRSADNMSGTYVINNADIDSTGYRPVEVTNVQQVRHVETRKRYGANLILDYSLPSGIIKSVNIFSRLSSSSQDYRQFLDYRNGNINFNFRASENDIDVAVNTLEFEYDFNPLQVELSFASTYAFNTLPESPYIQFFQTGGIGGPVQVNTIPDSLTHLQQYLEGGGGADQTFLSNVNLYTSKYKENNQTLLVNLLYPFTVGSDLSAFLKIGGNYGHQHHTNDQETPYATLNPTGAFNQFIMDSLAARYNLNWPGTGRYSATNFTSEDSDLYATFLDDRYGPIYWMVDPTIPTDMASFLANTPEFEGVGGGQNPGGWFHGAYQSLPNDYTYNEDYYAGYAMTELNFLDFMLVGGVRYEKVKSKYEVFNMVDARNPQSQTIDTVTAFPQNEYWLPMVQVRYKPFEWVDVRYAYTETLARPDYHQLSPHINMDFSLNNVWAGNPKLTPAQAFNHDLIFSFHSNEIGLLTIGGFYKTIKNFTYSTQYKLHPTAPPGLETTGSLSILGAVPKDGATLYTFINSPYEAIIKGIELDFQTRFWYLPFPLSGIVLGFNYTHISSEATYPFRNDRTEPNPNPPPRFLVEVFDSTRTGRLIYQPDNILNTYIGFDYEGFSARLSFIFQGNSVSYVGAYPEQDGFTRDYFRVDASVRQILPWTGLDVYLDLFNMNSRRNTSAQQSIGGFTNEQNYGLTLNLGLRYRM